MPDRHLDPEIMDRYLRGEAAPEEREWIERHLAGCTACRRRSRVLASSWVGGKTGYLTAGGRARAGARRPALPRLRTAEASVNSEGLTLP